MGNKNVKKIAVALPYAVSIRDFVHSGTLNQLISDPGNRLTLFTINPNLPEFDSIRSAGVMVRTLVVKEDSVFEKIAKSVYPLFFSDQFVYVSQSLQSYTARRYFSRLLVGVRCILGTERTLSLWSRLLLFLFKIKSGQNQLTESFDLLIGTRSLINSLDYGVIAEATLKGMPVLMIAGSWDNFTTKGYFPFPAIKTIVWNEKMKDELVNHFAIPPNKIDIAGYPRAALLQKHAYSLDAKTYLRGLNISGYNRFVLYSASYSELTRVPSQPIPLEYMAIRKVCEELTKELPKDTCVLIRLHPFSRHEDESCFEGLERCYVFVPGRQDHYVERVMNEDDERHLALQINQSVCVVSMASTISIDALSLCKPIINVAFDPVPGLLYQQSIVRFYEYNHFRDLVQIAQLPLAKQVADVIEFVVDCLSRKSQSCVDYLAFKKKYVASDSNKYPERVCATVKEALKL